MKLTVPNDKAVAVRRPKGITITFLNKGANSVYYAEEESQLLTVAPGAVPNGTELASTDQLQYPNFPGVLWFRSAVVTALDVLG